MSEQQDLLSSLSGKRVTAVAIGTMLGVTEKTARKRLADGLNASDVITICRELDVNPVEALVEMGFVSLAETMDFVDSDGELLATADQQALFLELADRMLTTTQLADMIASRTRTQVPATTIGTDDTVVTLKRKANDAERSGLLGTPATEQELWAARHIDTPSPGEVLYDHLDGLGEESQIGPEDD
ncbi:hypothetical protein [Gordonia sp. (in: high G+C Gram-positive bacteria)]|uniref:hypothetical protein n=1 Tax=Gordonia sp. (in: high G+C Gram-positive bacteria) TaxID=84139 RepID=UPI0033418607